MAFNFKSPSIKFNEIDRSLATQPSLGITSVGIIGETLKGPAFNPVLVTNKTVFTKFFGSTSHEKINGRLKFLAATYADAFLEEGSQLYFTKILGLSGYDAGTGWAITVGTGPSGTTSALTQTSTGASVSYTDSYLGINISSAIPYSSPVTFVKSGNIFTGQSVFLNVLTYSAGTSSGTLNYTANTYSAATNPLYENMVVAVLRSRGSYVDGDLGFNVTSVTGTFTQTTGNALSNFTITGVGISSNEKLEFNLDYTSSSYITKVIGKSNKDTKSNLYIESVYPDLIKKLSADNSIYEIKGLVQLTGNTFTDYETKYTNPETPWIVSELNGSNVNRLFKFISYSDGNAANQEIKISIESVDPSTGEFDVIVRDFNDTDENQSILERFVKCSLNPESSGFIMRKIGGVLSDNPTEFLEDVKSDYIYVLVNINAPISSFPCGFEGYLLRNYDSGFTGTEQASAPVMFYKTSYDSTEKISKTYLGISEKGYNTTTTKGKSINPDLFNFNGAIIVSSSYTKTKGFHMDSGATGTYTTTDDTIGQFEVGVGRLRSQADTLSAAYRDINKRKFTVVPYAGFDGWDIHRDERTFDDTYAQGGANEFTESDYNAYLKAFTIYEDAEATPVNILSTPGINWSDNTMLVKDVLEIIEESRQDALYIIDAPDVIMDGTSTDYAEEYASLMDAAELDSSYAATYVPYIRRKDPNSNVNIYIPATGEALKALAYQDKTSFVWFAPAGLNRGGLPNAKDVRKSFKESDRDTLYVSRMNPIIKFANSDPGIFMWGQKTLQVADTKLDRIDVRRLLLYSKQIIKEQANKFIFEPEDEILVSNFITETNKKLKVIQDNRGLSKFEVLLDNTQNTPETRDRNEIYFVINLTPKGSVEFIGVTFTINKNTTSISFNNI